MELTSDMAKIFEFFGSFFGFMPPVVRSLILFVVVVVVILALCNLFLRG